MEQNLKTTLRLASLTETAERNVQQSSNLEHVSYRILDEGTFNHLHSSHKHDVIKVAENAVRV